jgi:hypothetical protein
MINPSPAKRIKITTKPRRKKRPWRETRKSFAGNGSTKTRLITRAIEQGNKQMEQKFT